MPVQGRRHRVPRRLRASRAAVAAEALDGPKLTIKVGFNYGPVVAEGGDVFGDTVNVCARLTTLAGPEQVLTTQRDASSALAGAARALPPAATR